MSVQTIPILDGEPFFDQVTRLDGVDYQIKIRYNQRAERFYLSLYSADGTEIAKGAKLVCNWRLFTASVSPLLPPGMLMVVPAMKDDDSPPKLGELGPGKRCELVYIPQADL
jgi:hypothetical protein